MPNEEHRGEHRTQVGTMTDHTLDSLARELAGGNLSRSQMLKRMGTVLLGVTLASIPGVAWAARPPGRGPSGGKGCRQAGQTRCRGACVFLSSDPNNCGACGKVCPSGYVCVNGACQQCERSYQTQCGGVCTDLSEDSNNCGACGNVCPTGTFCYQGACVCNNFVDTYCNGTCVDLDGDINNCGACGNVCPPTQGCVGGVCGCYDQDNVTQTRDCGDGICVNISFDENNCGGCGIVCGPNQTCAFGDCYDPED